ncbi:hypothetical protein [Alkalinema sp. FACHB-956]|uniref:hypothetical protein n=1 Tax=Alkalinema sp. FACHB-956 TaxID=2692768 RepID=UPI001686B39C|nr:hypothetical protein [Alkalinema sp. FACHB-956]MBD2325410.1 hypothetical protein [Alkalinema sp. FACHB-956]
MVWVRTCFTGLCFTIAWGLVGFLVVSLTRSLRQGYKSVKRLHQIPCSTCRYFTGDYNLKCTIHPVIALSESAIGCRDYHGS